MTHDHDLGFEPPTEEQLEEWIRDASKVPHGRDHLTLRHQLGYADQKIKEAEGKFEAWETIEVPQPKRDAKGDYVVQDGLVVTEIKRVSKSAHALVPLLQYRDQRREQLRQHFRSYPGPESLKRRCRELEEAVVAEFGEGNPDDFERREREEFRGAYKAQRGWLAP